MSLTTLQEQINRISAVIRNGAGITESLAISNRNLAKGLRDLAAAVADLEERISRIEESQGSDR